jgi:hypothetical protein
MIVFSFSCIDVNSDVYIDDNTGLICKRDLCLRMTKRSISYWTSQGSPFLVSVTFLPFGTYGTLLH